MGLRAAIRGTIFLLTCAPVGLEAVTLPVGPTFRVNSSSDDVQTAPALGVDGAGNFVVVWRSPYLATGAGQRLSNIGVRVGAEFPVALVRDPVLAVAPAGNSLLAWMDEADGLNTAISALRLDANGMAQGSAFVVNTYTTGFQINPAVTADPSGNFTVVWETLGGVEDFHGVYGQRYDSAGAPLGGQFVVNTYITGDQGAPTVGSDGAGNFVVAWRSNFDVLFARRFDSAGVPQGPEFQVNGPSTAFVADPDIAVGAAGNFVVAWTSQSHSVHAEGVSAKAFDATGTAQTGEIVVDSSYFAGRVQVAIDSGSDFLVVWPKFIDPFSSTISARRYESDGTPQGAAFTVGSYAPRRHREPRVAANGPGSFLVVWQEGVGQDIAAQRFSGGCGDGSVDAGEACDDGDNASGDGCSAACVTERCFTCAGAPSTCTAISACTAGDGCCAAGCTSVDDGDCPTLVAGGALAIVEARLMSFVSRDPAIDTTLGSGIDPVADDARLHVYSTTGAKDSACYELRNAGTAAWVPKGEATAPSFKYTDRDGINGVCKRARVTDGGLLRVRCVGDPGIPDNTLLVGEQTDGVAIRFTSGATEYCAHFGGRVRNDGPGRFVASGAPAPTVCPEPPLPCPLILPLGP